MDSSYLNKEFVSGKRRDPRIDFPATVIMNHVELEVLDWSLGGFAISDGIISEVSNQDIPIRFLFPISNGHLALELACQVVRRSENGYAVGFQFVNLSNAVKTTLNSILTSYLLGEKVNLNDSIKTGIKGKLFEYEQVRLISNWGKFSLMVAFILVILGFSSVMLYQKIFDIQSEYASVAQNIIEIPAMRTGELQGVMIAKGDVLHKGQVMFAIVSEKQRDKLSSMNNQLNELNIEIRHIENRYDDAKSLLSFYSKRLGAEKNSTIKKISVLNSEIKVQQEQYELLNNHRHAEAVDLLTRNKTLIELYNKKRTLEGLKEKLSLNENYNQIAAKGMFAEDNLSKVFSLNEIQDILVYKRNQKRLLEEEITRLKDSSNYRSPCDCHVVEINSSAGPVTENKTIVKLSENGSHKWILALVPLEYAGSIFKGIKARFRVASSNDVLSGTVIDVSYYDATNPDIYGQNGEVISGLPQVLPRMVQYTLVKILPDKPLDNSAYNEPAKVNIELGLWDHLKRSVIL